MKIHIPLKAVAAALAIAVPLAIGWSVTAGATFGDDSGTHTHDVYEIDGYGYERENIGGVVTNIITDPDGNVVTVDEAPAEIVEMVQNWQEPPLDGTGIQFAFADDGNSACYTLDNTDSSNDDNTGWDVVTEEQGHIAAARSQGGILEVQYFGEASNLAEVEAKVLAGVPLADITGAQEMPAC